MSDLPADAGHTTTPDDRALELTELADAISETRPEHMYGRKRDCRCRDCLLWDAEKLLRELAGLMGDRGPADSDPTP